MSILDKHWGVLERFPTSLTLFRDQSFPNIIGKSEDVSSIPQATIEQIVDHIKERILDGEDEVHLDHELFMQMRFEIHALLGQLQDAHYCGIEHVSSVVLGGLIQQLIGTFLNTMDACRAVDSGCDDDVRQACMEIINGVESETIDAAASNPRVDSPANYASMWAAQKIEVCIHTCFYSKPRYCMESAVSVEQKSLAAKQYEVLDRSFSVSGKRTDRGTYFLVIAQGRTCQNAEFCVDGLTRKERNVVWDYIDNHKADHDITNEELERVLEEFRRKPNKD